MADGGQKPLAQETVLEPIRLMVAEPPPAAPATSRRWRIHVPRIVDYLIVAAFIFFFW